MNAILKKNIYALRTDKWKIKLKVNETSIDLKIDTVSEVNLLPVKIYNNIKPKPKLNKTSVKLTEYNNTKFPVTGSYNVALQSKNAKINSLFIVTETNAKAVIDAETSENLELIKRIHKINKMDIQGLIEKYEDCYGDIGKLPVTHHITVNPDVKP